MPVVFLVDWIVLFGLDIHHFFTLVVWSGRNYWLVMLLLFSLLFHRSFVSFFLFGIGLITRVVFYTDTALQLLIIL